VKDKKNHKGVKSRGSAVFPVARLQNATKQMRASGAVVLFSNFLGGKSLQA
jgi:hypothetical protein